MEIVFEISEMSRVVNDLKRVAREMYGENADILLASDHGLFQVCTWLEKRSICFPANDTDNFICVSVSCVKKTTASHPSARSIFGAFPPQSLRELLDKVCWLIFFSRTLFRHVSHAHVCLQASADDLADLFLRNTLDINEENGKIEVNSFGRQFLARHPEYEHLIHPVEFRGAPASSILGFS